MASLKSKDIKNMSKEDRNKKIKELKLELVRTKVSASKAGTSKAKEIRKVIARLITFNKSESKPTQKIKLKKE